MFSLVTYVGNSLILHVIRKTRGLHWPSFILLGCLAASDLLVGAICQPFYGAYKIAELADNFSVYCRLRMFQNMSGWITSSVSCGTVIVVSIDRLLSLTLQLRYDVIVTVPRVFQAYFVLWIISMTVATLRFWILTAHWVISPVVILLLNFLVTSMSTSKIFQIVRRHQRQINEQNVAWVNVQINMANIPKCRKSAVAVLYVYGSFLIFYIPFCVTMIMETISGYTRVVKIPYDYASTAVNSFFNPLVY